jgi:hypothetical protein
MLGFPVLRLRGDYLAIVTLGFGEIIRIVLLNWQPVTGGPNGISGIPRPTFFGLEFDRNPTEGKPRSTSSSASSSRASTDRLPLLPDPVLGAVHQLRRPAPAPAADRPAWEALREDEIACKALGINPTNTKLTGFALGAMFGGFAGSFFATRQGFISPESFTFIESAIILAIVVLGGLGQPDRRRAGRDRPGRAARGRARVRAVPDAAVRRGDGGDHGLAPGRNLKRSRAHAPAEPEAGRGYDGGEGGRLMARTPLWR